MLTNGAWYYAELFEPQERRICALCDSGFKPTNKQSVEVIELNGVPYPPQTTYCTISTDLINKVQQVTA